MGYHMHYPTQPSHPAHCVFHDQQVHASWECLFLSDYDAPFQVQVSEVVFDLEINANIPSMQQDFHHKNCTQNANPDTLHW
jgi:hypothetical protein